MNIRYVLFLLFSAGLLFDLFTYCLTCKQRQKPLPEEIRDIYTPERYQTFLAYKKDYRPIYLFRLFFNYAVSVFFVFSDFFAWFDHPNPYWNAFMIWMVSKIIDILVDGPLDYYTKFTIKEKYGLNKQTKKDYFIDLIMEEALNAVATALMAGGLIFVVTHVGSYTSTIQINVHQVLGLTALVVIFIFVIVAAVSLLSLLALKKKYHFTELEEGELRTKIENYLSESRKKVRHIYVYDESRKSTDKNAFVLKLFFYREIGIADNFLNENAEDELLAVLLHEIGHLKHKKEILNYFKYLYSAALVILLAWLIYNNGILIDFNNYLKECFGLTYTSYYLILIVLNTIVSPILSLFGILNNYQSCREEKEADFNAVDHGYGEPLIKTFKKISSDELIDVNPHPLIEVMEYDHPSMVHRIKYIQERMNIDTK